MMSLTSCYSYRFVDKASASLEPNKTYRLQIGEKRLKVKNLQLENGNFVFTKDHLQQSVLQDRVILIEERQFSYLKTIGLIVGIVTVVSAAAILVALSNFRLDFSNFNFQMPP